MRSAAPWTLVVVLGLLGGCAGSTTPAATTAAAPDEDAYTVQAIRDPRLHKQCIRFCRRIDPLSQRRCVHLCDVTFRGCAVGRPGLIGDREEPEQGDTGDSGDTGGNGGETVTPTPSPEGGETDQTPTGDGSLQVH